VKYRSPLPSPLVYSSKAMLLSALSALTARTSIALSVAPIARHGLSEMDPDRKRDYSYKHRVLPAFVYVPFSGYTMWGYWAANRHVVTIVAPEMNLLVRVTFLCARRGSGVAAGEMRAIANVNVGVDGFISHRAPGTGAQRCDVLNSMSRLRSRYAALQQLVPYVG